MVADEFESRKMGSKVAVSKPQGKPMFDLHVMKQLWGWVLEFLPNFCPTVKRVVIDRGINVFEFMKVPPLEGSG